MCFSTIASAQSKTDHDACNTPVENGTAITLTIGNTVIPAVLNNSVTARDLISRLPLTISLHRYSHDFCGIMSNPLKHDPTDVQHGWKNGDIHFATDGPYFVLFFADEEISKQYGNQVHIGKMNVDLKKLRDLGSDINVKIALDPQRPSTNTKKVLVAYYSHTGNTRAVAENICEATDADIFEIIPETAYSQNHDVVVAQAKKEIENGFQPPLKTKVQDISQYDVIFVGSPCWWFTIAPPVATFLASHDFSGKTIIPFMTHEGSRMGHSENDIKKLCPRSTVLNGLPIRGSSATTSEQAVRQWLSKPEVNALKITTKKNK